MATLIAEVDHLKATIGKQVEGRINVFLNFSPLQHFFILQCIQNCTAVQVITNVSDYENGTGGLGIRLAENKDEEYLKRCLEEILYNYIHAE